MNLIIFSKLFILLVHEASSQDIELIDQANLSDNVSSSSSTLENPNEKAKRLFTSPSIENFNDKVKDYWSNWKPSNISDSSSNSPDSEGSNSSTETIKPPKYSKSDQSSSSITPKYFEVTPIINTDWKDLVNSDSKQAINYVESHLPKNEFDDTDYLNRLIKDVDSNNTKFAQEIVNNKLKYSSEQLKSFNDTVLETEKWINKMKIEVNKFD
uniref:hypothetical protein n=1 Tax=Russula emetica TaxID=152958 RepID=UPI0031F3F01E